MTVRELIYALRTIPDDSVVVLNNDILGAFYVVEGVLCLCDSGVLALSVGDRIWDG